MGFKNQILISLSKEVKQQEDVQHENMHEKATRTRPIDCSAPLLSITSNGSGKMQEEA